MNEEIKNELIKKISRCKQVINALENNPAWEIVIEDYKKGEQLIDNNWINEFDEKKLNAMRVAKMATREIVQLVDKYKFDLKTAEQQLNKLENPDKEITADWDNE